MLPALALDRRAALAAVSLALAAVAPPGSPAARRVAVRAAVARRVGASDDDDRISLRGGAFGVPWWALLLSLRFGHRRPVVWVQRLLPAHHPHAERRSLVASVAAMEFFAPVAVAGLLGFPLPEPSSAAAAFAFAASSRAPRAGAGLLYTYDAADDRIRV